MFYNLQFKYQLILVVIIVHCSGIYEYIFTTSYDHYYTHWGPSDSLAILKVIHKNEYVLDNKSILIASDECEKGRVDLVLLVKSKYNNFELRRAIRQTWGNKSRFNELNIKIVFIMGKTKSNSMLQNVIQSEANLYGDIIQGNFIDTYYNITLKTQITINWAFHSCQCNYYAMIDDDYYVSPKNVIKFLKSNSINDNASMPKSDYFWVGYYFPNSAPISNYFSKWYISLREYKYSRYPPYITGGFTILSRKSFDVLYFACQHTNYFKLDDIFIGMAAKFGGLKLSHLSEVYYYKKIYSGNNYHNVIASHGYSSASELIELFNKQLQAGEA